MAKKKSSGSICCMDDSEWRAESDLRTLVEAEKIKKDKARYGAAMKCHAEQMKALAAIKGPGGKSMMKNEKTESY